MRVFTRGLGPIFFGPATIFHHLWPQHFSQIHLHFMTPKNTAFLPIWPFFPISLGTPWERANWKSSLLITYWKFQFSTQKWTLLPGIFSELNRFFHHFCELHFHQASAPISPILWAPKCPSQCPHIPKDLPSFPILINTKRPGFEDFWEIFVSFPEKWKICPESGCLTPRVAVYMQRKLANFDSSPIRFNRDQLLFSQFLRDFWEISKFLLVFDVAPIMNPNYPNYSQRKMVDLTAFPIRNACQFPIFGRFLRDFVNFWEISLRCPQWPTICPHNARVYPKEIQWFPLVSNTFI